MSYEEKEQQARELLKFTLSTAKTPRVCFSGGKKSVIVMHMARQVTGSMLPALHVSTPLEMAGATAFIYKISKLWRFPVITASPIVYLANPENRSECCSRILGSTLLETGELNRYDLLIMGSTLEDGKICQADNYPMVKIVEPLYHFTTKDIWHYISKYNLQICSLYNQGYEKIDCKLCMPDPVNRAADANSAHENLIREKMKKLGYM